MRIIPALHSAHYLTSSPDLKRCPPDEGYEVAFAGRSNAGKSSAINKITNQSKLAKTSKTPGRTQMINFFCLNAPNNKQRLVDLPGYGYAKVPIAVKKKWQDTMAHYLAQRQSLKGIILLMDIRHPLSEFDEDMILWADRNAMPLHILLTKADKLKRGPGKQSLLKVQARVAKLENPASVQMFSALKNIGITEAQTQLGKWLNIPESS